MSSSCTASQQITLAAFKQYIQPESHQDRLERRAESQPLHTGSCSMSLEEAPSPPLSPTSVTPTIERISWDQTPQRQRSHSTPLAQPQMLEMLNQLGANEESLSDHQKKVANQVADQLKCLGDELNVKLTHCSIWDTLMQGFRNPDDSVLKHFVDCIYSVKKELSLHMVVKIFYLGFWLLQSLVPKTFCEEQQWRLLQIFVEFLTNELTTWIDNQGGWETVLHNADNRSLRSQSTPVLTVNLLPETERQQSNETVTSPVSSPTTPPAEDEIVASGEHPLTVSCPPAVTTTPTGQSLSLSTLRNLSLSSPVLIPRARPSSLRIRHTSSFPRIEESEASSSRRSSVGSMITFGVGVSFGFALCSFFFRHS